MQFPDGLLLVFFSFILTLNHGSGAKLFAKSGIKILIPNLPNPLTNDASICTAYRITKSDSPYIQSIDVHEDHILDHKIRLYGCKEPVYESPKNKNKKKKKNKKYIADAWNCGSDPKITASSSSSRGLPVAPVCANGSASRLLFQQNSGSKGMLEPSSLLRIGGASGYDYLVLQVNYMDLDQSRKRLGSQVVDNNTQYSNLGVIARLSDDVRKLRSKSPAIGKSSPKKKQKYGHKLF